MLHDPSTLWAMASRGFEIRDVAPGLWIWRLAAPGVARGLRLGAAGHLDRRRVRRARSRSSTRSRRPGTQSRSGTGSTRSRRRWPSSSSPITSATSISSRAATRSAASGRTSSGAATLPRPSSRGSSRSASFPAGSSRSTTAAAAMRRRSGFPSSARSSSQTRSTAPGGELRVWGTPWHEKRVLPALRELLELPFEHVIVSHGEPVHDRKALREGARDERRGAVDV